jgi:hypothetical protein
MNEEQGSPIYESTAKRKFSIPLRQSSQAYLEKALRMIKAPKTKSIHHKTVEQKGT